MPKQITVARVKLPDQPSVLVVDDEKAVLLSERRIIRRHHPEWDVLQAQTMEAAQQLLEEQTPWVVIADRQMPDGGGAELLRLVAQQHPLALRVMLTGDHSPEAWLEGTALAHLVFAKPYDPVAVLSVLDRAACIHQLPLTKEVKLALGGLKQLPVVSETFTRLSLELARDEVSLDNVVELVHQDQALTARLLQLANSAFFGFTTETLSVRDAVIRLGSDLIRAIVLALELFHPGRAGNGAKGDGDCYRLAKNVAERAIGYAKQLGVDKRERDRVFIAGLLHNLGTLVDLELQSDDCSNADQCMVGGYLLALWGFNAEQVELVLNMCHPSSIEFPSMALVALHVAWVLETEGPESPLLDQACLEGLGLAVNEKGEVVKLS